MTDPTIQVTDKDVNITPAQAFGILAAAHAETIVENRLLRSQVAILSAKVNELTPPPEGEKASMEVVK